MKKFLLRIECASGGSGSIPDAGLHAAESNVLQDCPTRIIVKIDELAGFVIDEKCLLCSIVRAANRRFSSGPHLVQASNDEARKCR